MTGVLVAEVGGTTLRAGRYTDRISSRRSAPTPNHRDGATGYNAVLQALSGLCVDLTEVDAISVAFPGPVDRAGTVLATPTVLGRSEPFALSAAVAELWPRLPVVVLNDLTAAGYRYVAAGLRDFAIVTVGSGVGHKVFVDGAPLTGPQGRGGEIGHLRVDFSPDAIACDCGGFGHVGGLASGRGVCALVHRATGRVLSGPQVVAAYRAGDRDVAACVAEGSRYLGQAMAAIHLDTGIERIIVQGGFAQAMGDPWLAGVVEAAQAACWSIGQTWSDILQLGYPDDDSALLGAGWFTRSVRQ